MSSKNDVFKLAKSLTPTQVWALALGSIVGWGCFVPPGDSFLPECGPLATIIGFVAGAALLCFVAMSYAYMIQYCPMAPAASTPTRTSATAPRRPLSAAGRWCWATAPSSASTHRP